MTQGTADSKLTQRAILLFWAPLAATWLMMAVEGPFLAAVIARLADPKFNLAAHGVSFAFAVLMEAPVLMLMSAATALVEDGSSYRRLRSFATWLNVGATALLLAMLVPPVYELLAGRVLDLPEQVADLAYGALWLFVPWPAAIGYRRFLQGVLIRSGRTRLVALGTAIRLLSMAGSALACALALDLPGAWVGAAALSSGVVVEAVAVRWMAAGTIRRLLASEGAAHESEGVGSGTDRKVADRGVPEALGYRGIAGFYFPLALTSLIGLGVHPMLTFFMIRAPAPVESLAVFPVVHALSFIFRALGLSFQDASIALIGKRCERLPELTRFATALGLATTVGLGAIGFTPLARVWFETISGLTPQLTEFALTPARVILPLGAFSVLLSLQRAILMTRRSTAHITGASGIEIGIVALLFIAFGWGVGLVGVTAAFLAFVGGRLAANVYLIGPVRRALHSLRVGGGTSKPDS